jgi:hypothetical protein
MSYSKILSGDLPELTYDVLKYFKNDFSTLHSCILVNRLWCRLAIPLLWENPFSISIGNRKFIEIYLDNLKGDLKTKLNEYEINDNLFPSNTLFNYPSFLKYLYTWRVISSIERWFEDTFIISKCENRYFLQNTASVYSFKRLIHMSLYNLFIENEVNLHTLEIEISNHPCHIPYLDDVLESLIENQKFFHNIRILNLYFSSYPYSSINRIKNRLSHIINLHQNLKKIVLGHYSFPLYQSSLLSKDYNHSNTLNTIILYRIDLKFIINLDKAFEQLIALESVHIIYCFLNAHFIQQIINLTKPFKLKTLFIDKGSQIDESLELLLQKYGFYLENFGFGLGRSLLFKQQSLGFIMKYCKNIKFLDSCEFENQIIYLVFNLIETIKQSLNHLSINICKTFQLDNELNDNIECSSIILRNLGQILPLKLEYLHLVLNININDFEIFLKNSQNTFIKKFLINNKRGHNILSWTKEHIMKERRVKYLAILDSFEDTLIDGNNDLFSLKDEVKEFELYNIKIQKYNDLVISNILNFIK